MKKLIAVFVCFALFAAGALVFAGCGSQNGDKEKPSENGTTDSNNGNTGSDTGITGGEKDGGWTKADSPAITQAFSAVFEKATSAMTGMEYVPVAYLASQAVAGTNHCVLCKATATVPDAETTYAIVYVYEDLNGGAEITGIVDGDAKADVSEGDVDGGWSEPDSPAVPEAAAEALTKACETLAGMEYAPVALLATQTVAGMNYRILCEAKATVPNAETEYAIVTVYADTQGNAKITDIFAFGSELTQLTNPQEEYGSTAESLSAAEEAVGFTLALPGSVTPEDYIVINGAILEADFNGGYIRKAKGNEDISGDYNEYDAVETVTANGKEVTLKGNADKTMLALWTDGDHTYCVVVTDGTTRENILSLVNEIK